MAEENLKDLIKDGRLKKGNRTGGDEPIFLGNSTNMLKSVMHRVEQQLKVGGSPDVFELKSKAALPRGLRLRAQRMVEIRANIGGVKLS